MVYGWKIYSKRENISRKPLSKKSGTASDGKKQNILL
jgi:hypothetical protein